LWLQPTFQMLKVRYENGRALVAQQAPRRQQPLTKREMPLSPRITEPLIKLRTVSILKILKKQFCLKLIFFIIFKSF
jgi:hypothetical protein